MTTRRRRARRPGLSRADLGAGVVLGVESVPSGLATGVLAGINPVWGLYAYMTGLLGGAVATSSSLMAVQGTSAMAVVIADVPLVHAEGGTGDAAVFTLAVLTGALMLGLGVAGLGSLVRFVPHTVLTGFVSAVAVTIVLGQLDELTGYTSPAAHRVAAALDTVLHVSAFHWPSVTVAALTIGLILALDRTPLGALGLVVAVAAGSAVSAALGGLVDHVATVADVADIPRALPTVSLPDLALVPALLVPAASLTFVGLVQGAAITTSTPNPDGRYPDPSGDFRGQGVANLVSGLLHGMPVGGSMSATQIVVAARARSRAALVVAAVVTGVVVVGVPGVVGHVAMPALAGLLVVVGVRTVRPTEIALVWRTGPVQATVMTTTFALTLLIPLQYAVLVGVGLSVVLHVVRQAGGVRLRQWTFTADGAVRESQAPTEVPGGATIVLRPYGSLFFAAVPRLEAQLPEVTEASRGGAVVLSLRGTEQLGATFVTVVARYARRLEQHHAILLVAGASPALRRQLTALGAAAPLPPGRVVAAEPVVTASTRKAVLLADRWRAAQPPPAPPRT